MLQNKINAILSLLGLNQFEIQMYIFLLNNKKANITTICKQFGAYSLKVYTASPDLPALFDRLRANGLDRPWMT